MENKKKPKAATSMSVSSDYTDSPEFVVTGSDSGSDLAVAKIENGSIFTEKTTQLFSGFKTPNVTSGRWRELNLTTNKYKGEAFVEKGIYDSFENYYDPYPSWNPPDKVPVSREEIESIFVTLTEIFGFQMDNTKNMFDYLLRLLDSRGSKIGPHMALQSLHQDYISGENSNYTKWVLAADLADDNTEETHHDKMHKPNPKDCIIQLALFLLCWGEASNIRFMPECLCFIFKCCNDYYYSLDLMQPITTPTLSFLDHVIAPLYNYYRDQNYEFVEGKYQRRNKDHADIIGYDDINQLFWYKKGLKRMVLASDKTKFMEIPAHERYLYFADINWSKVFFKTYKESRTWVHVIVNFNRIWIIHCCMFWYYIVFNSPSLYTKDYQIQLDNQPPPHIKLVALSLSGVIATSLNIFATIGEYSFVPRRWYGAGKVHRRLIFLTLVFCINMCPSLYLMIWSPLDKEDKTSLAISIVQFIISLITGIYFAFVPLGKLFGSSIKNKKGIPSPAKTFTESVYQLKGKALLSSCGLWVAVFLAKFLESYYFLILSFRDPVRELGVMKVINCSDGTTLESFICAYQPKFVLVIMYITDLSLFFLDTYLWYIIWNTVFSVSRSFYMGVSIWTPWRNIFSRLPKRIFSKVIYSNDKNLKPKVVVSQIWNSIVIAMYREHLISLEHVEKLIYQEVSTPGENDIDFLKEPIFFVSQEDRSVRSSIFRHQIEAQRRITFFAQSLSTPMPEPCSIDQMPSFTVLIPHFSEKITLTLKEIIKEEDEYAHVTLLEYLKQLHPLEWNCFVQDTKLLAEEIEPNSESGTIVEENALLKANENINDLPYYCVGFKSATPEYVLRTRIWASLRSQTLYRTISGFMNYSKAIKLLNDIENPNIEQFDGSESKKLESNAIMALRKFRLVVSMQRMTEFNEDEKQSRDFLLRAYPELQICYLDFDSESETFYSCLIDGSCEFSETGEIIPKYKVKLPGNPILGDGKSDNQNSALIYTRGEYIQLIDANQDNYLEECLKIRSILAEFDELHLAEDEDVGFKPTYKSDPNPIAIIGTREYIFSENIGVLGDIAAGKEQTFGTLFARTLAQIGGKLHYGHPDFLNSVFMTTRGGVSKAQKGLHLNEDIYAAMNAILRGGRIKHCEYIQCGKGRDLGFESILNFTSKIGAGMGEQMLSREYYYLGTQLPLDRLLSFYYGHPGFHLNNVFIILSVKLLLLVAVSVSSLSTNSTLCEYSKNVPFTDPRKPAGCYNLTPVIKWLSRCVLSIFVVFAISFVPLFVQELTERGIWKAISRLSKHFASFSPFFEVFVCKIYAQSLINDLAVGGAKYIATGRNFATVRVPFSVLYTRFAPESLYFGAVSALMIIYCTKTINTLVIAWFWITVVGLCFSPIIYNPNQFSWSDFFLDYKNFIVWLSSGNSAAQKNSWISYARGLRSQLTGSKKRTHAKTGDKLSTSFRKPSPLNVLVYQILAKMLITTFVLTAYLFASFSGNGRNEEPSRAFERVFIVTVGPILVNMVLLIVAFGISITLGPVFGMCCMSFASFISWIIHAISVINYIVFFQLFWFLQKWDFYKTVLGYSVAIQIQSIGSTIVTGLFLSKEMKHSTSNRAWWSGLWLTSGLGIHILTQPLREYICKVTELCLFANDVILGHLLLFAQIPFLLIPGINKWHSLMLFWLKPSKQLQPKILTKKKKRKQTVTVGIFSIIFFTNFLITVLLFMIPHLVQNVFNLDLSKYIPEQMIELFS